MGEHFLFLTRQNVQCIRFLCTFGTDAILGVYIQLIVAPVLDEVMKLFYSAIISMIVMGTFKKWVLLWL